jgi:peptidoglycan/LPS O-acetylase OafA/YrhL
MEMQQPISLDPDRRLRENLMRRSIPGIDGIRGLSALMVVAFHCVSQSLPGRQSVQMFFILSGLLITWLMLEEERRHGYVDLKAFYWRRAFRLLPPVVALIAWEVATDRPHVSSGALLAAGLYYANYYWALGGDLLGLTHTWSLAVEEHFYLFWPFVFVLARDHAKLTKNLFVVAALSVLWRVVASKFVSLEYAAIATECNATAMALGCALALLIWHSNSRIPPVFFNRMLVPLSLVAIVGSAQLSVAGQFVWGIVASLPFAAILLLQAITYEWRILNNSIAQFFGRISYGVYLWQFVAFSLVDGFGLAHFKPVVKIVAVVILATLSHFLLEEPVKSMGKIWLASASKRMSA